MVYPPTAAEPSRIDVSVGHHGSIGVAVVGQYDCAGNPGDKAHQNRDTAGAVRFLRERYPDVPIIGLWIDETWSVEEIQTDTQDCGRLSDDATS